MPTLKELDFFLRKEFQFEAFTDFTVNGLQVGNLNSPTPINTIALAVDCDLTTIKQAVNLKANMLLVHHGLFWGTTSEITGIDYEKIKLLINNNIALYAIHLPLDAHPLWGNNAQIAAKLLLQKPINAFEYKGSFIGIIGEIQTKELLLKKFNEEFSLYFKDEIMTEFIPYKNIKVGVCSGSLSGNILNEAIKDCNVLVTGEMTLPLYNFALERNFTVIRLGHYYSETGGVSSLTKLFTENFPQIKPFFIENYKPI